MNKNMVGQDICGNYFRVHDLLRDLGQDIGRKSESHIVDVQMAEATLMKNQGSAKTTMLDLGGSRKQKFLAENFSSMTDLHFLRLSKGCVIEGDLGRMSEELRWLQWKSMPFAYAPTGLNLSLLTLLDFSESTKLASLWTEANGDMVGCPNLCLLNLNGCTSISKLPDSIGQSLQLWTLWLSNCTNLKELPKSIGHLTRLEQLDMGGCRSLRVLPDNMDSLSNLKYFWAYRCFSLMKLPSRIGYLSKLAILEMEFNEECEISIDGNFGNAWKQLSILHLHNCDGIVSIIDYGAFKELLHLDLVCNTITELPDCIGLIERLKWLIISCARLQCLPKSIGDFQNLIVLKLEDCKNLVRLPKTLGALIGLEDLRIRRCGIIKLPRSLGQLSQLKNLIIKGCMKLQRLPASITQLILLEKFELKDCGSIHAMGALTTLQGLPLWGSKFITKLPATLRIVSTLIICGHNQCSNCMVFASSGKLLEKDDSGFLIAHKCNRQTELLRRRRCGF